MIQIVNRSTRAVLYESDAETLRSAVEQAVHGGVDLRYADLHGAVLHGAVLTDADLHGADLHGAWAATAPAGWEELLDSRLWRTS